MEEPKMPDLGEEWDIAITRINRIKKWLKRFLVGTALCAQVGGFAYFVRMIRDFF